MGKTYRDGRGEPLLRLHDELGRKLALSSKGRVRVPSPVGYLTDLRMALFAWARGRTVSDALVTSPEIVSFATDALAALHSVPIKGLADFTVTDECDVIRRWHTVLGLADRPLAEATRPLLDSLLGSAGFVKSARRCTLHRDFYERQFVYDACQ